MARSKRLNGKLTSAVRSFQVPKVESLEQRLLLDGSAYFFSQYDAAWQADPMIDQHGTTFGTIGKDVSLPQSDPAYWGYGCAMTDVAMLLKYYGMSTDPHQLNEALSHPTPQNQLSGYSASPDGVGAPDEGEIDWNDAATYSNGLVNFVRLWNPANYQDSGDWADLHDCVVQGHPVIVKVHVSSLSHWVLVTSFNNGGDPLEPRNYSINDPIQTPDQHDLDPDMTLARYGTFDSMVIYSPVVPVTASVDVAEVIDHSGSMADSSGTGSGTKLDAAKDAANMFVDMLNPGDKIGVVGYSDTATVDFPVTAISDQGQNTFFGDAMDTAANWTASSPWGLTGTASHSGGLCFTDSPVGDYANDADTSLTMTNPITLPAEALSLSFWTRYDLEAGFDHGIAEVSSNGGPWTQIGQMTGIQDTWTQVSYSLSDFAGQSIRVRFRLTSDSSIVDDGWWVDDVSISGSDARPEAKSAIDAMDPTATTSIGSGVQAADNELDRFPGDPVRAMLVLTDGLQNTDPEPLGIINSQVDSTVRIYTIGYGSDADASLLAQMADLRGGRYYFAPSADNLREIYFMLSGSLSGQQQLASAAGTVTQGGTTTQTATIDASVTQARFELDWTGGDMDLSLVSPDGTVIDHNTAASYPGITLTLDDTYEVYTIDSPQAGQWTMHTLGVNVPSGTGNFNTYVTATAGIHMYAATSKNTYSLNDAVHIVAALTDGAPISGGSLLATVTAPAGVVPASTDLTLYDDGAHGDGAANDGVYANDLRGPHIPGSYNVTVHATGLSNDGAAFARTSFQSIAVWPCMVKIDPTGQINATNSSTIHFTAIFTEPVSGFTSSDVTLEGTAGATTAVVTDSGDHTTYDVAVSGMTGNGTVIASLVAGAASDGTNHASTASTSVNNVVTYETTPPTADLGAPANGGSLSITTLNERGYLYITLADVGGSGLSTSTITDSGQEFTLSGAGAGGVVVDGSPTFVSGTVYRYNFTGAFVQGAVSVSFTAGSFADNAGNLNSGAIETFTAAPPLNVAPTANPQDASTDEDNAHLITLTGGDIETPAEQLVFAIATGPAHGTLGSLVGNQVTYTPDANYNGPDSFTFTVTDGGALTSSPATVSLTVTPTNDAPSANPRSVSTDEDVARAITLTGSDIDVPPGAFVFTIASGPAHGSLGSVVGNEVTYTPDANYNGADSFTFTATDAGGLTSSPATVSITIAAINDAPSFTKGSDQTVNEGAGAQSVANWATAISAGAANESSQTLTFLVSNDNPELFLVQPVIAANGTLSYTPAANANGVATMTATLNDNRGTANGGHDTSASQTFTITVNPANDKPVATGQSVSVNEDGSVTITLAGTDIETLPANLTGAIVQSPQHGTLTPLGGNLYRYQSNSNYSGSDSFTFTVADSGDPAGSHANPGNLTSNPATVNITVAAVNDAPSFIKGSGQTVNEGAGAQSVANWATAISAGAANESSQTLTFQVSNDNNNLFSVQPAISSSGTLTYTPAANASGTANVTVILKDNGGKANGGQDASAAQTFAITVNPVNDKPVATGQSVTVNEDGAVNITLAGTDAETLPANLTAAIVQSAQHGTLTALGGKLYRYQPSPNYHGSDSFTFTVTDTGDAAGSHANPGDLISSAAAVSITVNSVNDAPAAIAQSATVGADGSVLVTLTGTDVETPAGVLTFAISAAPTGGSLTYVSPGVYRYTVGASYGGSDMIQFTATDNGDPAGSGANVRTSAPATVSISGGQVRNLDARGKAVFPDGNGEMTTVALTKGGTGWIFFASAGQCDPGRIVLSGTTDKSTLTITTKGTGSGTSLGSIDTQGSPIAKIVASTTDLLGRVSVGPSTNAKAAVSMTFDQIVNANIQSGMPVKSLTAAEWLDDDGTPDVLAAPAVGTISIKGKKARSGVSALRGDFQADLNLGTPGGSGLALGNLSVAGVVDGSTITGNSHDSKGVSIGTIKAGRIDSATMVAAGGVTSMSASQWRSGGITAGWIGSIVTKANAAAGGLGHFGANLTLTGLAVPPRKATLGGATIAGDLRSAVWDITGNMGALKVSGTAGGPLLADALTVKTTGSMGAITLGASSHADFLASVNPAAAGDASITWRADDAADFVSGFAAITSITINPARAAAGFFFVDSNFSAPSIGAVKIVNANFNNDQAGLNDTQDDLGFWTDAAAAKPIKSVTNADRTDPRNKAKNWTWKPVLSVPTGLDDLNVLSLV